MNLDRIVANVLADALEQQPWWKRYAGTITMACSMLVAFGTWVTTTYVDLPRPAMVAVGAIVAIAGVIAARATPNGITPRSNAVIERDVATELGHYVIAARDTAAEYADPIAAAVARGFTEHDPRYLGMTLDQAARAYLDNIRTR